MKKLIEKFIVAVIVFFLMVPVAWGATYTKWIDGTLRNPISQQVIEINNYMRLYRHQINFAAQTLDAGNGDVAQVILLPKNCMVLKAWIRVVTACPTNSTVDLGYGSDVDYFGNALPLDATGISKTVLTASGEWNPGSISDGDEEAKTLTVDSVASGDVVQFTFSLSLQDLALTGSVSASNTVNAVLGNWTGGAIDLATGTLVAYAYKAPLESVPLLLSTSDTIDIKATTDIADVNISSGVIEVNVLVMSTAASGFPQ
uniref:Putative structural protein n=1 Tax=viral metagenome TaxID=1070528 RepID=A0A6H1ZJ68_9ZZZZ